VLLSSLDLSLANDVVDINMLLKRLKLMELPSDVTDLVQVWLRNIFYNENVGGQKKFYFIQGSLFGPLPFTMFMLPLFDLELLFSLANSTMCVKKL
jgi:hypothetical protein